MADSNQVKNPIFITEADEYVFGQGNHYEIYEKLGAHKTVVDGVEGVYFAVWAPNAQYVNVIGSFNNWDLFKDNMQRLGDGGIFALFIPEAKVGDMYKYVITTPSGEKLYKADPYANQAQLRPDNASIVADLSEFTWTDTTWMRNREKTDWNKKPVAIYECHIGSWMKHPVPEDDEKAT